MKQILGIFIILIMVISACETEITSKNRILSKSNIIIDTVLIDPGDQLIFPYLLAERSFFTENYRFLFNFNDFDHSLEKIDLDKLELADKYPFEKEGPNGTGNYVDYLVSLDSGRLLVQTSSQAGIFDWEGNKIGEFDPLLEGASLTHVERKAFQPVRAAGGRIYGLIVDNGANTSEVGYVDLTEGEFSTIPLAKEFRHGDFNLEHRAGNTRRRYAPEFHIQAFHKENRLIVGSTVSNRLYIFDPETHHLVGREYNLALAANEKIGVYKLETEDEASFQLAYVALQEEVSFGPLLWDVESERYYRFFYELSFLDEHSPGRFPKAVSTEVYLMVLDKELNLLHELSVPQLTYVPYYTFAKDGMIWMFENMEDEIGFVRLSVSDF